METTKRLGLVTGASGGLGEQFARLLARDGHDVVLVARSADKLEALAQELRQSGKVQAHVVPADLTDPGAPQTLWNVLQQKQLAVDFLLNNAGFGSTGPFLDLPLKGEADMVEVNIAAMVKLTHLFGTAMRQRGFGRVLNIASSAGFQPGPFMATYYATKSFVISWSRALAFELRESGVTVTCHCPGATETGFARRAGNDKSKLFQSKVPGAEEVALHGYQAMMAGKDIAVHGLGNWFSSRFAPMMPAVSRSIAANLNRA